uniref:Nudix hydrolase domain-containing protein n=1 Tax=Macrostomum lignano TaxID=282301 RepID=A0A1I8IGY6_9PLAT
MHSLMLRCCRLIGSANFLTRLAQSTPVAVSNSNYNKRLLTYASGVAMTTDRYGGVMLDLSAVNEGTDEDLVMEHIRDAVSNSLTVAPAAWVRVPLHLSSLTTHLAVDGFRYHHAEGYYATLVKWLRPGRPSKVPRFGTHQLGVAGLLIDGRFVAGAQTKKPHQSPWKLPGGVADLGEEIGDAAVREVAEETGIAARFESVLAFRHHHWHPMAFNRSDFYVLCRLSLDGQRRGELKPCPDEISKVDWLTVSQLDALPTEEVAPILRASLPLIRLGLRNGFKTVDMQRFALHSLYTAKRVSLYHRPLLGEVE